MTATLRRIPVRPSPPGLLLSCASLAFCAWLGWLILDSWQYGHALDAEDNPPAPLAAEPRPAPTPLDTRGIARLFGAMPAEQQQAVPLSLLASLADTRAERSRALIQSPQGAAFYGLGARLPGGAVLKAIATDRVLILLGGHEQVLTFPSHTTRLLAPLSASRDATTAEAESTR
ncbi:TPA: hypothetical protein ONB21_001040 [Pseudomonas aeruginosa]|nr:hypothetical protein [Pseudomonas aeruginosa]